MEVSSLNFEQHATILPGEIYSNYLKTIDGISFTHRELDIIACILGGRANKKMAALLSISPKTVDNHVRNIMLKLGISSRECLIDFIEKSGKYLILKKYYLNLLILERFELELEKISSISITQNNSSVIICEDGKSKTPLFFYLKKHLNLVSIKPEILEETKNKGHTILQKINSLKVSNIIYFLSLENASDANADLTEHIKNLNLIQLSIENKNCALLLVIENNTSISIPSDLFQFKHIDLSDHGQYCFLMFDLLQKMMPALDLGKIFLLFMNFLESFLILLKY